MLLTEKYKPKTFDKIIGLDSRIPKLVESASMPHFLFSGPAGTGKSTTAKAIVKTLDADYLWMNASDDTGIDNIRERVKKFAMTLSTNSKFKVVIFDEADGLSPNSQECLRGIIDQYGNNCRFILTCNYIHKIKEPIVSRCIHIVFKTPTVEQIEDLLDDICKQEAYEHEAEAIKKLVEMNYPDIRSCIKQLQLVGMKDNKISLENLTKIDLPIKEIVSNLRNRKLAEAAEIIEDGYTDYDRLMELLSDEFFFGKYSVTVKKDTMDILRKAYFEMSRVKVKNIIVRPMLKQIMDVLKVE